MYLTVEDEGDEEKESDSSDKQKHQLKHRELFLSRQVETLPATHIRGKCVVTLLNETESYMSYLNKDVSVHTSQCLIWHLVCLKYVVYLKYFKVAESVSHYMV